MFSSCFINQIILMLFTVLFQKNENFDTFVKKLSCESHLADDSQEVVQVFLEVDHEVIMAVQYYIQTLFSICAIHHVCNIEYPKSLKCAFSF